MTTATAIELTFAKTTNEHGVSVSSATHDEKTYEIEKKGEKKYALYVNGDAVCLGNFKKCREEAERIANEIPEETPEPEEAPAPAPKTKKGKVKKSKVEDVPAEETEKEVPVSADSDGKIFGYSATSVLRYLAKANWNFDDAKKILLAKGIDYMKDQSIRSIMATAKKEPERKTAEITPAQEKELKKILKQD